MAQGWECFSARQNPPGEHRAKRAGPTGGNGAKGPRAGGPQRTELCSAQESKSKGQVTFS